MLLLHSIQSIHVPQANLLISVVLMLCALVANLRKYIEDYASKKTFKNFLLMASACLAISMFCAAIVALCVPLTNKAHVTELFKALSVLVVAFVAVMFPYQKLRTTKTP